MMSRSLEIKESVINHSSIAKEMNNVPFIAPLLSPDLLGFYRGIDTRNKHLLYPSKLGKVRESTRVHFIGGDVRKTSSS